MKIIYSNKYFFLFVAILASSSMLAQVNDVEITNAETAPYTPENLITNVFLGDGVEVTSFEFSGDPKAIGFFKNGMEEIGIERGIVMTTGLAASSGTVPGADGTGAQFASSAAEPNVTVDADLSILDPTNGNNDVARYVISFIPTSDTVRFNYSFASEEYPEWACSSFNDVFGFFISGPGISGPFSNNADNIALIPGTDDFVSINNLHPANGAGCNPTNDQFYNNNNGSSNQPVYDGFTDVFTAEAVVIPCEEYTIKLAISDKGDNVFDSGVFLQAKSFGSPTLDVDVVTVSLDGSVVEGCSEAIITIGLPDPVEADTPLDYEIFGVAENGVDFVFIPDNLFIPEGESSIDIPLIAIEDGIIEGAEEWAISFQRNICDRDTFYLSIKDNELIAPDLGPDLVQCQADTAWLDGSIDIPLPPIPTFTNETDFLISPHNQAIASTVQVTGVQPLILNTGVIKDICFNIDHNWDDDMDVFLQSPAGQFIELSTDNGANGDDYINTCFSESALTPINFPGPFAPAEAAPFTGNWQPEGIWSDLWDGEYPTNGEWTLLVIDDAQGFTGQLLDWTIRFEPSYQLFYEWTPTDGLTCSDCPNPGASPLESTTYTLRIYDSYGCETFDSIYIEVNESLIAPTVVCSNITAECITFSWDDVGTLDYEVNIDNTGWIPASDFLSHTVCGLAFSQTVNIQVRGLSDCDGFTGFGECTTPACPVPTVVNQTTTDVSCNGGNDGAFQIELAGGTPPFSYILQGQTNTTGMFSDLIAGLDDIVITDGADCELTLQVSIEQPEPMVLVDIPIQNISCNAANDGSATLIVTEGTAPYSFEWENGETDSIAVALIPGPNLVTVTDAQGCEIVGSIVITEPEAMLLSLSTEIILCNGANTGMVSSMVEGGEGAYTYAWSDELAQDTPDAIDLIAGDYTLVVTDENNCSISEIINIPENSEITTNVASTQATCSGTGDGTATASGSGGGVNFFTFQWDANANNQTTATATGLDVGWYFVTITDLLTCAVVDSIEITAPNAMDVSFVTEPTDCFDSADGNASISVLGGTEPYTYAWSDGPADTPDRDDLLSGNVLATVTDANGCFVELDILISSPAEIILEIGNTIDATCAGAIDGTITVNATGGSEVFTYLWDDNQTMQTATNLIAGNHCVTVTDENDCSATICADIAEPQALTATENITDIACFGTDSGSITVTIQGGTEPYEYLWSDGAAQTTETAIDLVQGDYEVLVMDANDCSITVNYTVNEAEELTATTGFTALSCDGTPDGTATATPSGGTAPFTYLWSDGAAQTTQTAIDLEATTYTVTVIDANLCEVETSATLTEPVAIVLESISATDVSCFGGNNGTATVTYTGGTAPFEVLWSTNQMGETVGDLPANNYTVVITDQSGCIATETVVVNEPSDLVISLDQSSALCNNGNDGTASVVGLSYGVDPADLTDFTFAWNSATVQTTPVATGLIGGQTYEVEITDLAGCQWTENITVDNPPAIEVAVIEADDISCFEGTDGRISVQGSGGTAPFEYLWSANANSQTTQAATDLSVGIYNVTVTDINGCATATEIRLEEPEQLIFQFGTERTSCAGIPDGIATLTGQGGTPAYQFNWEDGSTLDRREDLVAGFYPVTLTDANNCQYLDTIPVSEPEPVITDIEDIKDVTCFGYRDGLIDLFSEGGTPPYSYSLDGINFSGSSSIIALEPGSYDITIQDGNGCEFNINDVEIGEPDELIVDLGEDIRVAYGQQPQLQGIITGSAGGNIYEWNPIGPFELSCYDCSSPRVDTLSGQATFELTITDENGCTASDLVTVFISKNVYIAVPTGFTPNGDGNNDWLLVHGDSKVEIKIFRLYDRWGELLYEGGNFMANDTSVGWDGTFRGQNMPNGVYVWYLEVEAEDGELASFKGNTTLMR